MTRNVIDLADEESQCGSDFLSSKSNQNKHQVSKFEIKYILLRSKIVPVVFEGVRDRLGVGGRRRWR